MPANKSMRLRAMFDAYRAGATLEAVATEFGVELDAMLADFRERGFELNPADVARFPEPPPGEARPGRTPGRTGRPRGRQPIADAAQAEVMYAAYEEGRTLAEVAAEHGVSAATVGNIFKRQGYDIRPRGTRVWSLELAAAMYAQYEAGETLGTIAAGQDLSTAQVRAAFRQHGFALKAPASRPPLPKDEQAVRGLYGRYESGDDLETIAETAELSVGQLKRLFLLHHLPLKRMGAPPRPAPKPAPPRVEEPEDEDVGTALRPERLLTEAPDNAVERERLAMGMYELFQEGYPMGEIAAVYRTTAGLVQQLFAEYGLATTAGHRGRTRGKL